MEVKEVKERQKGERESERGSEEVDEVGTDRETDSGGGGGEWKGAGGTDLNKSICLTMGGTEVGLVRLGLKHYSSMPVVLVLYIYNFFAFYLSTFPVPPPLFV